MRRATIAGGAGAVALVLLAVAAGYRALDQDVRHTAATAPATPPASAPEAAQPRPAAETYQGFLYGKLTTLDGTVYEGRLRWGIDQEAFWGDYFNGVKHENPWLAHLPPERQPKQRRPRTIFGIEIGPRENHDVVRRPLMARFGEVARIEARGREVRATLKSGSVFDVDRFDASDFDDGVRVWDRSRGVVDLESLQIDTIELLPTPPLGTVPSRLYGTVRTRQGAFTGFVGWNRTKYVGTDELAGLTDTGKLSVRFDTIRSIARSSSEGSLVTLLDGREIALSGTTEGGNGANPGLFPIYVDDPRYGRVQISWDAFERVDFSPSGSSGPAYDDFPPGRPLSGSVTTRAGRRLTGRLVYDLDESETTDTLDADSQGVHFTLPFGLIAAIAPAGGEERAQRVAVTLHGGEQVLLEGTGDVDERNAGVLVVAAGRERGDFVPWPDVERIDLDRPPAMYPPLGGP